MVKKNSTKIPSAKNLPRRIVILEEGECALFHLPKIVREFFCICKGRYLYDVRTRRDEGGSGHADEVREVA